MFCICKFIDNQFSFGDPSKKSDQRSEMAWISSNVLAVQRSVVLDDSHQLYYWFKKLLTPFSLVVLHPRHSCETSTYYLTVWIFLFAAVTVSSLWDYSRIILSLDSQPNEPYILSQKKIGPVPLTARFLWVRPWFVFPPAASHSSWET